MLTAPVLWFAASVILIGLEIMAPVGAFLFFGFGALGGWIAALLDMNLTVQLLTSAAVCVLSLVALRRRLTRIFSGFAGRSADEAPASPLTGQHGVVTASLAPGQEGQVSVGGSYWRAASRTTLAEGERVVVTGTAPDDATVLMVRAERGEN